jgi:hypothetical protein
MAKIACLYINIYIKNISQSSRKYFALTPSTGQKFSLQSVLLRYMVGDEMYYFTRKGETLGDVLSTYYNFNEHACRTAEEQFLRVNCSYLDCGNYSGVEPWRFLQQRLPANHALWFPFPKPYDTPEIRDKLILDQLNYYWPNQLKRIVSELCQAGVNPYFVAAAQQLTQVTCIDANKSATPYLQPLSMASIFVEKFLAQAPETYEKFQEALGKLNLTAIKLASASSLTAEYRYEEEFDKAYNNTVRMLNSTLLQTINKFYMIDFYVTKNELLKKTSANIKGFHMGSSNGLYPLKNAAVKLAKFGNHAGWIIESFLGSIEIGEAKAQGEDWHRTAIGVAGGMVGGAIGGKIVEGIYKASPRIAQAAARSAEKVVAEMIAEGELTTGLGEGVGYALLGFETLAGVAGAIAGLGTISIAIIGVAASFAVGEFVSHGSQLVWDKL